MTLEQVLLNACLFAKNVYAATAKYIWDGATLLRDLMDDLKFDMLSSKA